jgi:hypothetical protein
MVDVEMACNLISSVLPLFSALFAFVYGLRRFFKKGKPLFLQTITMAMGSHVLGSIYHLCHSITNDNPSNGFTPAYLGRIGFFLFIITASYGQFDRIVDDGSPKMKKSRLIALIAPFCAEILYIPIYMADVSIQTKISYALIWIPAVFSVYFNLKHSIVPDLDFGFIKALKPYNRFVLCLSFSELIRLMLYNYHYIIPRAIFAVIFSIFCICTIVTAGKGVKKWTI